MSESDRPAAPEAGQEKDAALREDEAGRRPSEGKAGAKVPPDGEIIGELGDEVGGPA
jgi:hypothetical protein